MDNEDEVFGQSIWDYVLVKSEGFSDYMIYNKKSQGYELADAVEGAKALEKLLKANVEIFDSKEDMYKKYRKIPQEERYAGYKEYTKKLFEDAKKKDEE